MLRSCPECLLPPAQVKPSFLSRPSTHTGLLLYLIYIFPFDRLLVGTSGSTCLLQQGPRGAIHRGSDFAETHLALTLLFLGLTFPPLHRPCFLRRMVSLILYRHRSLRSVSCALKVPVVHEGRPTGCRSRAWPRRPRASTCFH